MSDKKPQIPVNQVRSIHFGYPNHICPQCKNKFSQFDTNVFHVPTLVKEEDLIICLACSACMLVDSSVAGDLRGLTENEWRSFVTLFPDFDFSELSIII